MSGSISVDDPGLVLTEPAVPITVSRFDGETGEYAALPNVVCEQVERRVGPHPSTARFRYVLDHAVETEFPTQFEEIWPITATGPYVVQADDRLVVHARTARGRPIVLFDGFAQLPQATLAPGGETVGFTAVGVEARAWDDTIDGRVQRDAGDPEDGDEFSTDLPVRFNPSDGHGGVLPNCTPEDHDVDQSDDAKRYPVFLEERIKRDPDPRRYWGVADACCYLLATANDEQWVKNPDFADLRAKVAVRVGGDVPFDPGDPARYTRDELPLRDLNITGDSWPEVLDRLLSRCGLGYAFRIEADVLGDPVTRIRIERKDASTRAPRTIRLDAFRESIDPVRSNVESLSLVRDGNSLVNAFSVHTPPRRVEVSIVLAPGFTPASGDESGTARNEFLKSRLADATAEVKRKYRWYVADECGDGHWNGSWVTGQPLDLSGIFPPREDGTRSYVERYRPGAHKLLSTDSLMRPRQATLHYSQDYVGGSGPAIQAPAAWDGSGTWTEIGGGWRLLEDRLGIEVTAEDPEQWHVAKGKPEIKGITWQANPPIGKRFYLLLTTVIEDDLMIPAVAGARVSSPTKYNRWRSIDAGDHYRLETLAPWSWYNQAPGESVVRDDTDKAEDLARQYRAAHEMPPLSGAVTLPHLTTEYDLFDRVREIAGRDVSLRTNIGADQGEGPRYPQVVKVSWQFAGDRQSTTLQLTDLRGEPSGA